MASDSPISEGFRRAFREPAIVLAEIAWRWSFGAAASALVIASLLAYLDTLPITRMQMVLLRSRIPWLIADALGQIVRGSGPRLAVMVAIMLPAISVIWIAAASLGRAATLKALLHCEASVPLSSQVGLSFLRASVNLAALIGYLGALIVSGRAAAGTVEVRAGVFFVVFVALATAVALLRSRLNWFLCLGAISAARDGHDTFAAVAAAIGLFRRHTGKFAWAGAVFGSIHFVLFALFTVISLLVLALAAKAPPGVSLFFLAAITLAYFALVDALYIARLAAYAAIDENDRRPPFAPVAVEPEPVVPEPPVVAPEPVVGLGISGLGIS
jgi:hypothetical protein